MATSTQDKGKRAELLVFGELIRRGAELYTPMVDKGIDAVVRGQDGRYLELQVKAKQAAERDKYFDFNWEPKENRFFICVSLKEDPPKVWVLPSDIFSKYARARTKQRLALPEKKRGDSETREKKLEQYCATTNPDAWKPLLPPQP